MGDCRGGTVTRIHRGVVGKDEKLLVDGIPERVEIAPREICSSNRLPEKSVAAECRGEFREIKANATPVNVPACVWS